MPPNARATILVVDNEPQILSVVHLILSREGYRVLAARNLAEAARLCAQHDRPVDLVLADHETLQSADPCPGVRTVLMGPGAVASGHTVLQKPFTPESLTLAVRQLLG